ncbi:hypothetical protein [Salipiger mangrovisoli]|uniref:Uncharacterized protein n=1 Tax=Salipiger mangrovisoli TaxID=2865933 RepID=A0ABR9X057_9RHOB|nr:hypothetical protein [Salipiger mangrovisoli]MBE9636881.1 hypothetical protein [Salipiger mangrovisoli]
MKALSLVCGFVGQLQAIDLGPVDPIVEHPAAGTAPPFRICARQAAPALVRHEIDIIDFFYYKQMVDGHSRPRQR